MSTPSQNEVETAAGIDEDIRASRRAAAKQRIVHPCNFRSAGRLSNEDARSLSAMHETFALHLTATLDNYLGTAVEVKLETVDQLPIKDHIADVPPLSYIVPFSSNTLIVELDNELVFPIIELLMGGAGSSSRGDGARSFRDRRRDHAGREYAAGAAGRSRVARPELVAGSRRTHQADLDAPLFCSKREGRGVAVRSRNCRVRRALSSSSCPPSF